MVKDSIALIFTKSLCCYACRSYIMVPLHQSHGTKTPWGPVIIYVGGGGGGKSWGGPKENFTMIGGGSLCVLYRV